MIGGARGAAAGWNVLLSALVIAVLVFLDRCVLGGSVPVAGTTGGKEVRGMRSSMLVLAICASCTVDQSGAMSLVAGRAPNAPPGELADGAAPADAVQWDAVPPPAPDAAAALPYPRCPDFAVMDGPRWWSAQADCNARTAGGVACVQCDVLTLNQPGQSTLPSCLVTWADLHEGACAQSAPVLCVPHCQDARVGACPVPTRDACGVSP